MHNLRTSGSAYPFILYILFVTVYLGAQMFQGFSWLDIGFYMFASSSPDPTIPGGYFQLVNTGIESQPSEENVIYYQVGLASTSTYSEKWYNGEDTLPSIQKSSLLEADMRQEQLSHELGWFEIIPKYSVVFEDEGVILIRAADSSGNQDVDFDDADYRSGVYKSTIYLHVVSDE